MSKEDGAVQEMSAFDVEATAKNFRESQMNLLKIKIYRSTKK